MKSCAQNIKHKQTQKNTRTHAHTHTSTHVDSLTHPSHTRTTQRKRKGVEAKGVCVRARGRIQLPQSSLLGLCQKEYMVCYINIILVKIHTYYLVFIVHWNMLMSEMESERWRAHMALAIEV